MGDQGTDSDDPLAAEEIANSGENPQFRDFMAVSNKVLEGYSDLAKRGFRPEALSLAMVGAVVNFHQMFNMSDQLPDILRGVADRLDEKREPH